MFYVGHYADDGHPLWWPCVARPADAHADWVFARQKFPHQPTGRQIADDGRVGSSAPSTVPRPSADRKKAGHKLETES